MTMLELLEESPIIAAIKSLRSSEDRFRDTLRSPIPFYLRHGIPG